MQVSIETTSGLERRLTVGVPAQEIDAEVTKRLQQAAKTVRINGFRKGKVPLSVVQKRFGAGVRQEVLGDVINRSFQQALRQQDVRPAGQPKIEPKQAAEGETFEYVATFEVYPQIDLQYIDGTEITRYRAEVTDADVEEMIQTLRKNQASWQQVEREARDGDRVNIDFSGTKDGEAFDGGSATDHNLVLGSNTMIPGFEAGIVGMQIGEERTLPLTFPDDYQVDHLKGAQVEFKVKLNSINEQQMPELGDDFFASFGVQEGGLDAFRRDVRENMEREKDNLAKNRLKTQVLDELLKANQFDVPKALVDSEIDVLRQQAIQQYGQLSSQMDLQSLLPDHLFQERAHKRTALGLLIAELVSREKITADKERVRETIESIAATYEDPQSVISYYYSNEQLMSSAQAAVLEDQVVDHLVAKANVVEKDVSYQELVKPPADATETAEEADAAMAPSEQ